MRHRRILRVLTTFAAALALAGCGSSSDSTEATKTSDSGAERTSEPATTPAPTKAAGKVAPETDECTTDVTTDAATLQITNSSADPVDVYWLGFDCTPVHYVTIKPGGTSTQKTFVDHQWAATSGTSTPVSSHQVSSMTDRWEI